MIFFFLSFWSLHQMKSNNNLSAGDISSWENCFANLYKEQSYLLFSRLFPGAVIFPLGMKLSQKKTFLKKKSQAITSLFLCLKSYTESLQSSHLQIQLGIKYFRPSFEVFNVMIIFFILFSPILLCHSFFFFFFCTYKPLFGRMAA